MSLRDKVWFFSTLQNYLDITKQSSSGVITTREAKGGSLSSLIFGGRTSNTSQTYLSSVNAYGRIDYVPEDFLSSVRLLGNYELSGTPDTSNPVTITCNNGDVKVSKNLVDLDNLTTSQGTSGTYSVWGVSPLIGLTANSSTTYGRVGFVFNVEVGETYTIQLTGYSNGPYHRIYLMEGNTSSWNTNYGSFEVSETPTFFSHTFTATSNEFILGLYISADVGMSDAYMTISQVQLEKSFSVSDYHPYKQVYVEGTQETVSDSTGVVANVETLFSLSSTGPEDNHSIIDGVVTRNVGVIVLDGTESWATASNASSTHFTTGISISDLSLIVSSTLLSTHFSNLDVPINASSTVTGLHAENGVLYARLDNTTWSDVSAWRDWLSQQYSQGTPVIVFYKLQTSRVEHVTKQLLMKPNVTVLTSSLTNRSLSQNTATHTYPTSNYPLVLKCNNGIISYNGSGDITVTGTQEVLQDALGNTATIVNLFGVTSGSNTAKCDYQSVLSSTNNVRRNITYHILNGTETWQQDLTDSHVFYTELSDIYYSSSGYECVCNRFQGISNNTDFSTYPSTNSLVRAGRYNNTTWRQRLAFRIPDIDTLADWITWVTQLYVDNDPVIVFYKKITSTTETVAYQNLVQVPITISAGSMLDASITTSNTTTNVPTPQRPLDLQCANGVLTYNTSTNKLECLNSEDEIITITGENLINPDDFTEGYYLDSQGNPVPNPNYCYSGILNVGANVGYYTISGTGTAITVLGKPLNSTVEWEVLATFSQINNKAFAKTFYKSSSYRQLVLTTPMNTIKLQLEVAHQQTRSLTNFIEGYSLDDYGVPVMDSNYHYADISVNSASGSYSANANTSTIRVFGSTNNGNSWTLLLDYDPSQGQNNKLFDKPSVVTLLRVVTPVTATNETITIYTGTDYTPYHDPIVATNDELLLGTNNNYGYPDTYDVVTGIITRNMKYKILDGTETIELVPGGTNMVVVRNFVSDCDVAAIKSNYFAQWTYGYDGQACLCTYSDQAPSSLSTQTPGGDLVMVSSYLGSNISDWQSFFAQKYSEDNPVVFIYGTTDVQTEQKTPQEDVNIVQGTNVLTGSDTSSTGSSFKATYKGWG